MHIFQLQIHYDVKLLGTKTTRQANIRKVDRKNWKHARRFCQEGKETISKFVHQITTNRILPQHYIDLNDPYLTMNTERFQGQNDYLQMVSPPDFEKLSSPHYINDMPPTPATAQSHYMPMKPGHIFSPRERDGEVFTFSDLNNKERHTHELAPMLKNDSDYETQPNTPKSPEIPSYANPTYNKVDFMNEKNLIVNSPDNYVNMPKNKSAMKAENDKYTKDDRIYVNNVSRDWEKV